MIVDARPQFVEYNHRGEPGRMVPGSPEERPGEHVATRRQGWSATGLDRCYCRHPGVGAQARPDVILLRGGGEIQGKVIADPTKPDTVQVLLMKGRNPLTFQKKQILQVIPKPGPLDTYLDKKQSLAPTAESEFALGLWCDQNQLNDLAKVHYEAALGRDRGFEPAHKKLGHIQHGTQWLSPDEIRQLQGLVKFHGQWISEEAKAKREESVQASATQLAWVRRIKMLRQAIVAGSPDRGREAEAELMKIKETAAVLPLVRVLGQDEVPMRRLLAHVLGGIDGKESSRALVNMILAEPEDDVRGSILDRLKERDDPEIVPQLVKALRAENVRVVNRAAWTLGNLGAVITVPQLVGALVTSEERITLVSPDGEVVNPSGSPGPGAGAHGHERELPGLHDAAGDGPRRHRLRGGFSALFFSIAAHGRRRWRPRRGQHTQPQPGAPGRDLQLSERRGPESPDEVDGRGFRVRRNRVAALDQGLFQSQSQARPPGPSTLI